MGDKMYLQVTAGVIPGSIIEEYTKTWSLTSEEINADSSPADQPTVVDKTIAEATDYANELMEPRYFNWVNLQWVWL